MHTQSDVANPGTAVNEIVITELEIILMPLAEVDETWSTRLRRSRGICIKAAEGEGAHALPGKS